MPVEDSNSAAPSSVIRPRSGVIRPAIMLTSVVLPAPEAPNSAVTPPALSSRTLMKKSPRRFSTSRESTSLSVKAHAGTPGQPLRGDQRCKRDEDCHQDKPSGGGITAGRLGECVDGRRDRLRLSRNVGDERDGRSKLAECLGEAEHHACDQSGKREWQRDAEEYPQTVGTEGRSRIFELAVDRLDREPQRTHQQGKAHDPAGERRSGPAEREHEAEIVGEECADGPAPPERDEEEITGDHRRQHERQVDEPVEQRLAVEMLARKQPCDGKPERERHYCDDERDPKRQPDGHPFVGRELDHLSRNVKPCASKIARAIGERRKERYSAAWGRAPGVSATG